jgi:hypothetical protein
MTDTRQIAHFVAFSAAACYKRGNREEGMWLPRSIFPLRFTVLIASLGSWLCTQANWVDACPRCEAVGIPCVHGIVDNPSAPADGTTPPQYSLIGYKWPQSAPGAQVTITYSYNNLLDGGLKGPDGVSLPASLIRASVEEALSLWAGAAPLNFIEVPDQGGPAVMADYPDGQFGQIRFSHVYINGPDVPGQLPTTKALTYYPTGLNNLAADIFFDDSDPWQKQGTLPTPDVLGAAIHELGHALGLGHSLDSNDNMYWIFTRYNGPGTGASLKGGDIDGIHALYGTDHGSVTPLLVPEPATWVLAAIGAIGFAFWRRSRSRFRVLPVGRVFAIEP